jgi:DNA-directed RNA polymerase specialized sigma subunit
MKIPLRLDQNGGLSSKAAQIKALERDILASQKGDWNAKNNLVRTFMPLLTSLGQKRTHDTGQLNRLIEAGKTGLMLAAKKYRPAIGPDKFQVFALDFIESAMERAERSGAGGGLRGLFGRIFGRG